MCEARESLASVIGDEGYFSTFLAIWRHGCNGAIRMCIANGPGQAIDDVVHIVGCNVMMSEQASPDTI